MARIIEIQLGEYRPVQKYQVEDLACHRDDVVIMEVDRGTEFGRVVSDINSACKTKGETTNDKVLRIATEEDLKQITNNRLKAQGALADCEKKVKEQKLDMQLIKAEYTLDATKVIFFFTAEGRIDFRGLVKDLAKILKVRIELKQVGVRDKAKITGGYGVCGRELCCSSYMKGFHPLSIKMPKEQGLPLNPTRISGVCGRIKCCMAYEYQVYREYAKDLPSLGESLTTQDGKGHVIEVNILKRYVRVDLGEGKISKVAYAQKYEL